MAHYIHKHMLGWPVAFKDLASIDKECYNTLSQLQELVQNGEDLSKLCLYFTTVEEVMGVKETIELVAGGAEIQVDNNNFPDYLEACFKYHMLDRTMPQLKELLLGFFDVIPEPLIAVFDFQELELLMCGLPATDLDD
jgi:HECT-domain (ubiquitin-transferase)